MKKYVLTALASISICFITLLIIINVPKLISSEDYVDVVKPEPTVIHFIHWMNFPKEILTDFNKRYPNIKVEFEQYDLSKYRDVQRTQIMLGENIDIMGIADKDYEDFVAKGYLEDLSHKDMINNFSRDAVQNLEKKLPNKEIYAVPYKSSVLGIWYNKILFSKYNIGIPKNYLQFLDACEKLKRNGIKPLVLGCRDEDISAYIYYMSIWNIEDKDKDWFEKLGEGKVKWTDKAMREVFEKVNEFIKKGYLSDKSIDLTYEQAFSSFAYGQAAMCIMEDSSIDMYTPDYDKVCDLGVFPIPYNNSGDKLKVPGIKSGGLIGIYDNSKNKREAELFLNYLSQKQVGQLYSDETISGCNVIGVDTRRLYLYDLWEPLRKTELIEPLTAVLDFDMQKQLNKSAKELIIGVKSVDEVLYELQEAQEKANLLNKNK